MELLKYTIPAILVLILVYFLMHRFFKNEAKRRNLELKKSNLQIVTPTRMRAYERLALLLERINPNNMLVNKIDESMNCIQFQTSVLSDIRREFVHNISQQIYVSEELWEQIEDARENLIQLINAAATQCKADEPATKLASIIIEAYNMPEDTALNAAMRALKEEVNELF